MTFGAPRVGSARLCAACDEFVGLLSGSARLGSGAVGILLWADCFFLSPKLVKQKEVVQPDQARVNGLLNKSGGTCFRCLVPGACSAPPTSCPLFRQSICGVRLHCRGFRKLGFGSPD